MSRQSARQIRPPRRDVELTSRPGDELGIRIGWRGNRVTVTLELPGRLGRIVSEIDAEKARQIAQRFQGAADAVDPSPWSEPCTGEEVLAAFLARAEARAQA